SVAVRGPAAPTEPPSQHEAAVLSGAASLPRRWQYTAVTGGDCRSRGGSLARPCVAVDRAPERSSLAGSFPSGYKGPRLGHVAQPPELHPPEPRPRQGSGSRDPEPRAQPPASS